MRRTYDNANRLTQSVGPLGTTTFSYDAKNRRTGMTGDDQLASEVLPRGAFPRFLALNNFAGAGPIANFEE